MLTKLATFRGVSEEGEPLVRLFDPGLSMTKQAGEMMPAIKKWLDSYVPEEGKLAVLVNALGASEYWGQNVNGDVFPESALVHECSNHPSQQHPVDDFTGKVIPPYGAWTFMHAHPFVHHQNKDPNRAFGKVVLWTWNPRMHRAELIIVLDKKLALQHGAQHVIDRILAGEFPDVSMGCRVPYDICTICGHKSRTRKDYCSCIRHFGMGKFLDDGRQVGVINTYPRFFDISFVFIGADKTAKVMCKLGQAENGLYLPQSILDAELVYGVENDDGVELVKAASVQVPGNLLKLSEPRIAGVPMDVSDRILAGKVDTQENEQKRALSDGVVSTNADVNETDEFPEPLMPGRGKTASPLKKLFAKARKTKTAAIPTAMIERALGPVVKGSRFLTTTPGQAATGALVGGGLGAYLADDNRLLGGALGAGTGALAGPAVGWFGKRFGGATGGKILGSDVGKAHALDEELNDLFASSVNRLREAEDEVNRLTLQRAGGHLGPEDAHRLEKLRVEEIPQLAETVQRVGNESLQASERAFLLANEHAQNIARAGGLASVGGATLGGMGAGSLSAEGAKTASGLKKLWADSARMKIGPPPKPNRKKFPFTGSINFRGLIVHVENAPGSVREGKTPEGKVKWRTHMKIAYGEFQGPRGVDKDKLDVYVGPYRKAPNVYIIHQNFVRGPKKGKYDEDKVMVGFESLEQAKAAYLAHYDSLKYFRSATVMAFPLFKRAILKKEVHGEKVASVYISTMEKRAEDLQLEDLFSSSETAGRRSKVWRHSDGSELKKSGSGMEDWGEVKQASAEKYAALNPHDLLKISAEKWADIVKHIGPSKAVGRVSPLLSDQEPDIPCDTLDSMSERGLGKALSTASTMGMVLKPKEFQRVCLNCMGKGELANKMDAANAVFNPTEGEAVPCAPLEADQLDPKILEMLMPLLGEKSYFGPVIRKRIIRITIAKPEPAEPEVKVNSPLLSKVASAYNWYRREQMKLAADATKEVSNIPSLHAGVYGTEDEDLFGKTSAEMINPRTLAVVLGAIPLTLMYSAHLRGRQREGEDLNIMQDLVADHPWLATAGTAAALREAMKSPQAQQVVNELMAAGKRIYKGAPAPQPIL
jgi:hypothetical protein